jgi:purine nucleoside phosphorylase
MTVKHDVKIAVIGGSGLYHLENLEVVEEVNPETVSTKPVMVVKKKKVLI